MSFGIEGASLNPIILNALAPKAHTDPSKTLVDPPIIHVGPSTTLVDPPMALVIPPQTSRLSIGSQL